jgi:hypothetical protein
MARFHAVLDDRLESEWSCRHFCFSAFSSGRFFMPPTPFRPKFRVACPFRSRRRLFRKTAIRSSGPSCVRSIPIARSLQKTLKGFGFRLKSRFYVTTAISYPNGAPHIGHAYELIATDAIARFMRLDGRDVFFLTGTDEHGQKMVQTARSARALPRELADRNAEFKDMAGAECVERRLHPHHRRAPLRGLPGDLAPHGRQWRHLPRRYEGWYSVRDEAYYDEARPPKATTACARRRRARRSNGWRRRATSSACPPIRTSC